MSLPAEQRFAYFVRKAADSEQVWGLHDRGWATAEDGRGAIALPFWPERDFAVACAVGPWGHYQPEAVALDQFLARWLPGMLRDSRMVAVFPTDRDTGLFASPDTLMKAIQREMEQYEG